MKWFKRRKKVDDKRDYLSGEFSTYEIGGGWGNSIQFTNEKMERVYGFKRARPENGDFLKCPMQSGKTAVWRFCDVELKRDPSDMFFANIKPVGYREDIEKEMENDEHTTSGN